MGKKKLSEILSPKNYSAPDVSQSTLDKIKSIPNNKQSFSSTKYMIYFFHAMSFLGVFVLLFLLFFRFDGTEDLSDKKDGKVYDSSVEEENLDKSGGEDIGSRGLEDDDSSSNDAGIQSFQMQDDGGDNEEQIKPETAKQKVESENLESDTDNVKDSFEEGSAGATKTQVADSNENKPSKNIYDYFYKEDDFWYNLKVFIIIFVLLIDIILYFYIRKKYELNLLWNMLFMFSIVLDVLLFYFILFVLL